MSVILISCEKEETITTETSVEDKGYVVENGTIRFKSLLNFDKLSRSLMQMTTYDLINFRKSLGFVTLYDSYYAQNAVVDSTKINKVGDIYLASLLNCDGVLVVGDTTVKIFDENAYIIPNTNFNNFSEIQNDEELCKNICISKVKHTNYYNAVIESESGMQKFRGTKNQDGEIFTTTKLGTKYLREEKVILSAFCTTPLFVGSVLCNWSVLGASISGEARNKDVLWGSFWSGWFKDEIYYAYLEVNSGFTSYNSLPNTRYRISRNSYPAQQNVVYYECTWTDPYTDCTIINMDVTYTYQKNPNSSRIVKNINWQ